MRTDVSVNFRLINFTVYDANDDADNDDGDGSRGMNGFAARQNSKRKKKQSTLYRKEIGQHLAALCTAFTCTVTSIHTYDLNSSRWLRCRCASSIQFNSIQWISALNKIIIKSTYMCKWFHGLVSCIIGHPVYIFSPLDVCEWASKWISQESNHLNRESMWMLS